MRRAFGRHQTGIKWRAVMGKAGEFDTWMGFKTDEAGATGAGDALRRRIHPRLAGSILTGALLGDRMRNTRHSPRSPAADVQQEKRGESPE